MAMMPQRPGLMRPPVPLPQPKGLPDAMPGTGRGKVGPTVKHGAPSSDLKRMAILKQLKGGC